MSLELFLASEDDMEKEVTLTFKCSMKEADRLGRVSLVTDLSKSEIIRAAIMDYLPKILVCPTHAKRIHPDDFNFNNLNILQK